MLALEERSVGKWKVPAVVFAAESIDLSIEVLGSIANSVATSEVGRRRLAQWKQTVAAAVKAGRGGTLWDPRWVYAVSAAFSFSHEIHGARLLDVENFLKPTFDALAAGLFCPDEQDPRAIDRYNFDDSNFLYLFVHRLRDARTAAEEGVGLVVSALKPSGLSAV